MESVFTLIELELVMFLLMIIGGYLKRKNILTDSGQSSLSDLLMNVILPCNIFKSFLVELEANVWKAFAATIMICIGVLIVAVISGRILFRNVPKKKRPIMRYGLINGNVAFLGLPVCEGLYGSAGILNSTIYMIPHRILVWSYGMFLLRGKSGSGKKEILSLLLNPCMAAAELGLIFMLFQIRLPSVLQMTVENLGKCLFPMSMLIIGAILSKLDLKKILNRWTVLFSSVRLLLLPGIALAIGLLLGADAVVLGVSVAMAGMPCASITAILAGQFGHDQEFASEMVALTTLLSAFTIPLWNILVRLLYLSV